MPLWLIIVIVVLIVRRGVFGLLHQGFDWAFRARRATPPRASPPPGGTPEPVKVPDLQPTVGQREPA